MFQTKNNKRNKIKMIELVREVDLLIALMILHDTFDFGEREIQRMIDEYRDKIDSYDKKYFSYDDMREVIKDEVNIQL
ncbi:MAG: hypothetical protein KH020_02990 [Clostridiales bacterium]|nr:hypothetical protein [Clostridiales bacterium]